MRFRAIPLGAVVAALILAGCGGSSHPQPKRVSAAVIARAADSAAAQPGYAFTFAGRLSARALGGVASASGSGSLAADSLTGTLHLRLTLPGELSLVGALKTEAILTGGRVYVQVPGGLAKLLPGGRPWLGASFADLAGLAGLSVTGGVNSITPAAGLRELASESTGTALDYGPAKVAGVTTTHYRETFKESGKTTVALDAWIAANGLPRQLAVTFAGSAGSGRVTVDLTGYGTQPTPQAPPASQTGSLTSLISELGSSSGSGAGAGGTAAG